MKRNKGFTLIELLAVLVIIAIIALIITPIVTGVIKDSRIKASENAMTGLVKAVEVYYGKRMMQNDGRFNGTGGVVIQFATDYKAENFTQSGTTYTYNATSNLSGVINGSDTNIVEYKGATVQSGILAVDRDGIITTLKPVVINNYYCTNVPSVSCSETAS